MLIILLNIYLINILLKMIMINMIIRIMTALKLLKKKMYGAITEEKRENGSRGTLSAISSCCERKSHFH